MLLLQGHADSVQALAYTPDGETLLSAGDDCTIRVWDVRAGEERAVLEDHDNAVLALSLSADGRRLASGGHDKNPRLWDLEKLSLIRKFARFEGTVNAVALSPDGRSLVCGAERVRNSSSQTLRIHDLESGSVRFLRSLSGAGWSSPVWSLAYSPDGSILAVGWGSGGVSLLRTELALETLNLPDAASVSALAFSPDGALLATLAGNVVSLWNVEERRRLLTLGEHRSRASSVAFTPDGRYIATGGWDSTVRLWEVDTGRPRHQFNWQLGQRINAVAFAPDGMTAAVAGYAPDIVIWDVDEM